MKRIAVIGTGYVGLIVGTCFADRGQKVICVDTDKEKTCKLNEGKCTIFEPKLEEVLLRATKSGKLSFTSNIAEAIEESDIIFIAVGTPQNGNGEANLEFIKNAAKSIGESWT